ncbi:hypothetical protein H1R20_g294, partial [Candolleomyces eurysporus]
MDLIILSVGLTVLLARDVYKTVRRKRKEKKLRKKLQAAAALNGVADEEGHQYVSDSRSRIVGRPIAAPRTSRNHPDRPVTSRTNGSRSGRGNGNGNGDGSGNRRRDRRLRTSRGGEQYHYRHGLDSDEDEERIVNHHQSEYGRMPTPPPAYEPGPNPPPVARGSEYPLPPPFEHAYTAGATGQVAEAQRKAEGAENVARYGE